MVTTMTNSMKLRWGLMLLITASGYAAAWGQSSNAMATATTSSADAGVATGPAWAFSASVYTYIVPEAGQNYAQPTLTADHGWLHLEARYNYEALKTGSTWVGCNFSGGDKLAWEFTPMIGGVFGDTAGVAPGYKGSVSWWWLELYSEGEYVFDAKDSSESFFYCWSELTLSPVEWFRFGVVAQRTKFYETDHDIQRGLLVGFSYKSLDLTTYVFNPDDNQPTVVVGVAFSF